MEKTLTMKSSNTQIISFAVILGLFVLSMSGCQQAAEQVKNATNSASANTATNSEVAKANTNTNTEASNTQLMTSAPADDNCDGPGDNEVIVYEHIFNENGGGKCVKLKPGEYKNATEMGLANDSMSSFKVGVNVRATVCDGENFTAPCEEFEKTDYDLMNNPTIKNDTVSSLKVVEVKADQAPESKPEAIKTFVNNLVGEWLTDDGAFKMTFTEDKSEERRASNNQLINTTPYKVVDGKTVEFSYRGVALKSVITFEDDGNTLIWYRPDSGNTFNLKRVNPK